MAQRIFIALFSMLVSTFVYSAQLSEQTATGVAEDYNQALSSALFNAVQQANGGKFDQLSVLRADLSSVITENPNAVVSNGSIGLEERVVTSGTKFIDSYQVVSAKKPEGENKNWEVTVKAQIPTYKSLVDDNDRPSIAVMPFRFAHPTYALKSAQSSSNSFQISGRIKDKLLSNIMQTQRYVVVNRTGSTSLSNEFLSEAALLKSDAVTATEASRFGNIVGADLMVTGNIHNLVTESETKEFYGMSKTRLADKIDVSFQVVEVATQKVLWADTITAEFERKEDQDVTDTLDYIAQRVRASMFKHLQPDWEGNVEPEPKPKAPEKEVRETPGSSEAPVNWY